MGFDYGRVRRGHVAIGARMEKLQQGLPEVGNFAGLRSDNSPAVSVHEKARGLSGKRVGKINESIDIRRLLHGRFGERRNMIGGYQMARRDQGPLACPGGGPPSPEITPTA